MIQESLCANCGQDISQNFCPNCGQKKFKRIDGKYIKDEIQYTVLHTNKGFFYTIKNLVKNPGKTVLEYINGNRVNHYKPLLLAFVMSGISTYISYKILNMGKYLKEIPSQLNGSQETTSQIMAEYSNFAQNYSTLIFMGMIPFFALSSFIAFRKQKLNYFEHIIGNSYLYVVYVLFCLVFMYPILYIANDTNTFMYISTSCMLGFTLILPWFFRNWFPNTKFSKILVSTFLYILISGILFFCFTFLLGIIYAAYQISKMGIVT